jgi:uncharacterized protein (UPF0333 family)
MLRKRGQSTLEYVLVLTAIIAAVIVAANSFIKPRVEDSLNHVTSQMNSQVHRISFGNGTE